MGIVGLLLAIKNNPTVSKQELFELSCCVQSILWPRGNAVREAGLSYYNQFQMKKGRTERLLAAKLCSQQIESIPFCEQDWFKKLHYVLSQKGLCSITIGRESRYEVSKIVSLIHVTPLDTNGLLFYPRLKAFRYINESIELTWELAEAIV